MTKEEALEILGGILESSTVAITIADDKGNLTLFNKAAEKLTGFSREEVLGKPIASFYQSEEEVRELQAIVVREGKLEGHETVLVGKGGRQIPISILITRLFDQRGQDIGTLGMTTDLTEHKRLEGELREAKRHADFYNDLMCHDISNFNQTSLGMLELLASGQLGELTPEQTRVVQVCQRQIKRTRDLILRVRTLTSLETEGASSLTPMLLVPVLSAATRAVEESFPDRSPAIEATLDVQEVKVLACPLLFDLLYNLIANGVAHNPYHQPKVWIRVERGEETWGNPMWKIIVEDNGPGIPDPRKSSVFERFSRLETHGSGIGLSLVNALVSRYGGKVWVEDRVEGDAYQGARITTLLREARG